MTWTSGFSPAQVLAFGSEGRGSGGAMVGTGIMPWILTWGLRVIKAVNGNLYVGVG